MPYDTSYNPNNLPRHELDLEHFMKVARGQIGDKYEYGAEADGNPDPESFDSSELVEWAAHEAGVTDMPDGSWNQYRWLADKGAGVTVDEALHTKGALVFGFSSDPMASSDRPTRAYVGISLGDGKNVLDVSERGGAVREMPHGGFYNYGAVIPDFHPLDEPPVTDLWEDRDGNGTPDVWENRDPAPLPDSIPIDTDGDGIPDSSLPRPPFPGEKDTDGDGIPDSSVPDPPVLEPRPGHPVLVPDGRTTEDGPGDIIYEPDDDPVTPSAPAAGQGSSSQLIDQDQPADDLAYYPADQPADDLAYYPADDGGAGAFVDPVVDPVAAPAPAETTTTAYADASDFAPSDGGDAASTYSDSYGDSYTDLSADV
jgi:hypothetical protein